MEKILTFEDAINPDDFTFRLSVLQKYSPRELSAWITTNFAQIRQHLLSRIRLLLQSEPDTIKMGNRTKYLARAAQWAMNLDYDNYRFQPYSHLIALCGMASRMQSCHEVLFGEKKPVALRSSETALLDMYLSAPEKIQEKAVGILYASIPQIDNPVYVSYYRFRDLASEAGTPVNQWFTQFYMNAEMFSPMVSFKEELMQPVDDLRSYRSVTVGTSSLWWMILLVCIHMDISADFFLCDNYAYLAKREDRGLTDQEVFFMSAYLRASDDGRMNCRHLLMYQHLKD